jgi:hypothetical protein
LVYPPELNVFVEKKMLFKGEVSDANLFHNWHGYIVKKLTEDENISKKGNTKWYDKFNATKFVVTDKSTYGIDFLH